QVYKTDSREIAGPSFTDSKISGNIAEKGGGFYGYKTEFSLNRCIVSGNTATISGGGYYSNPLSSLNSMNGICDENRATGTNLTIVNSLVAGNDAVNGGGVYNYDSNATFDNCTLVANTAEENGGGIHSTDDSDWTILNTIIVGNSAVAIYSANLSETALVEYNLFNNNPDGDYYDFRTECTYTGANDINLFVAEATENKEGDPLFNAAFASNWTLDPTYYPDLDQTVFTDDTVMFDPDSFQTINIHPEMCKQLAVIHNTETTVIAPGNHTGTVSAGDDYIIYDYHIGNGSAALDRACLQVAPPNDFDGDTRPGDDGLVDIGMDEADGAFAPPEDNIDPVSSVIDLEPITISSDFVVPFAASDAESGVQFVELYFSHNAGTFQKFGYTFTTSPIAFSATAEGEYRFYTVATDNTGNIETAPQHADDSILFITDFTGQRIYVDLDATGNHTGDSWDNAIHDIESAILLASNFIKDEIWVAEGIYRENIFMFPHIKLYGGFAGDETTIDERDYNIHVTTIDVSSQNYGNPAKHAVEFNQIINAKLDGFTVTGGVADGTGNSGSGGGIFCINSDESNIIINCVIINNSATENGGGMAIEGGMPTLLDCTFSENIAGNGGGGLSVSLPTGDALFFNCHFIGNQANTGGGMFVNRTEFTLDFECLNFVFYANNAASFGGGIFTNGLDIMNCSFVDNVAGESGGGLYTTDANYTTVIDSVYLTNLPDQLFPTGINNVTYCNVQSGYPGEGNIDADPLFVAGPYGDFYLSQIAAGQSINSPCLNAGSTDADSIEFEHLWGSVKMSDLTTSTNEITDSAVVDMGYHYFPSSFTTPTPTPTPTFTPTNTPTSTPTSPYTATPSFTPSPTPTNTPVCDSLGVTMFMPSEDFHKYDICYCNATVCNNTSEILVGYPLFVILDVYGEYYFAPSFNTEFDYYLPQYPEFPVGETIVPILPEFKWPTLDGTVTGIIWYGAITIPEMTEVYGDIGMFTFGWS
ncbi:right-handed parallel beta-helix repeat-containing protein, partial [bacterium]|nr:right-handed parallel beta-helix repeat-containing protein [bacterium]